MSYQEIPENIPIVPDNQPVRILGSFIGNGTDQISIWTPTVETIRHNLGIWKKEHLTLEGKRLIINLEVGSRTQYLTRVQGMPPEVLRQIEKLVRDFLWDDKRSDVKMDTMRQPHSKGGKKCLIRDESRPTWAYVADELIKTNARDGIRTDLSETTENIFLQNWKPKLNHYSTLPNNSKSPMKPN